MKNPERLDWVLAVVEASLRERGYGPTIREISTEIGGLSLRVVHTALASLETIGRIQRQGSRAREILVTRSMPPRPMLLNDFDNRLRSIHRSMERIGIEVDLAQDWMTYTLTLERLAMTADTGSQDPVRNRWDAKCAACGKPVERAAGVVLHIEGKWRTHHHECSGLSDASIAALPEVGPKAPTEEERAARRRA